ncbi:hypothetical protein CR983_01430 [Candidatus Saccharibacteria bacterium]|nr:MAG: hypothetical protein CR983_01430 [Candidatus Saccharibacteria bacterium]
MSETVPLHEDEESSRAALLGWVRAVLESGAIDEDLLAARQNIGRIERILANDPVLRDNDVHLVDGHGERIDLAEDSLFAQRQHQGLVELNRLLAHHQVYVAVGGRPHQLVEFCEDAKEGGLQPVLDDGADCQRHECQLIDDEGDV